ncbi:MAG: hypothetical protein H7Y86_21055 [Rhizobacter sp.]|nr:hypothetical protein [Ferruginibacter sp.]
MKQALNFIVAGLLLVHISSCSKDDDNNNGGASEAVATSLQSGTWRVTSYVDNGTDETSDFSSFSFTFVNSGTVAASNTLSIATGTWDTGVDDSKHKLLLAFNNSALFDEISEDWEIVAQSSTQVNLRHISGGNGETDLLVFQKN